MSSGENFNQKANINRDSYKEFDNTKKRLHKPILDDIASSMKTTINISDALLQEAKRLSIQKNVTLRSLVEQGLREIIAKNHASPKFKIRKASFKGNGLQREFQGESWQKVRQAAYEGHGG